MTILTVELFPNTPGEKWVAARLLSDRLADPQLLHREDGGELGWRGVSQSAASSHCRLPETRLERTEAHSGVYL